MNTLTNSQRKLYASLSTAKGRRESGLFMAQGNKCVADTIEHFKIEALIATEAWLARNQNYGQLYQIFEAKNADMQKISTLTTAPEVIAVYHMPENVKPNIQNQLALALDCVQDPGNLGTIMRVADWMGVKTILASDDTVDVYNPKVVQATMGAISRVTVYYCNLAQELAKLRSTNIFGTFLDGENIYTTNLPSHGIIVMGNEGKGISADVATTINRRITIPSYPIGEPTSESLNVAVATAITLAEFRRRAI